MKKRSYKHLRFSTVAHTDSVVVMCGGPTSKLTDKINAFIKNNQKTTVIAVNYEYGIKADFLYFGDWSKFRKSIEKGINSSIIIRPYLREMLTKNKKYTNKITTPVYIAGDKKSPPCKNISKLKISPEGKIEAWRITPSGVAAAICGIAFRPSRMLLVGLDGPDIVDFDNNVCYRNHFNKELEIYSMSRFKLTRSRVKHLVYFLKKKKIDVCCFSESLFYHMKNKLPLTII